jgi:hypothetical protein
MKIAVSAAIFSAAVIFAIPAVACNGNGNCENAPGHNKGDRVAGAPGPIAGAGLPILAVGYGAYWLVRRYRRKSNTAS